MSAKPCALPVAQGTGHFDQVACFSFGRIQQARVLRGIARGVVAHERRTFQLVSVRYSPEVLEYFKSTGAGWQTRMNDALRKWVAKRTAR